MHRLIGVALAAGATCAALPAEAQTLCGPRDKLAQSLEVKYGETQRGVGLKGSAALYELWVSQKSGTWSFVVTRPNGISCLLGAGQQWSELPPPEELAGDPS